MGWNDSDGSNNFIHILPKPQKSALPKSNLTRETSSSLRIRVESDAVSEGSLALAGWLLRAMKGFNSLGRRGWEHCRALYMSREGGRRDGDASSRAASVAELGTAEEERTSDAQASQDGERSLAGPSLESETSVTSHVEGGYVTRLECDELAWELRTLYEQLETQRAELARAVTQIHELKAMTSSQQQVLMHLGKELDAIEATPPRGDKPSQKKSKHRGGKANRNKPAAAQHPSTGQAPLHLREQS